MRVMTSVNRRVFAGRGRNGWNGVTAVAFATSRGHGQVGHPRIWFSRSRCPVPLAASFFYIYLYYYYDLFNFSVLQGSFP